MLLVGTAVHGILALAWDGTNLYVGGDFTSAGSLPANHVARWDGRSWYPLGSGILGSVYALAWDGSGLYAGGSFTTAGGITANNIAYWNGSAWNALGTGMNNTVRALVWDGINVYAGGDFTTAGSCTTNCNYIARWNTGTWNALGTGMNGVVRAIVSGSGTLYVGGDFTAAGTCTTNCNRIARWSGGTWSSLSTGMNNNVNALTWDGTNLYAGGQFFIAGGQSALYVARWNGTIWSAVGPGGVNGYIYSLTWANNNLYMGGNFSAIGVVSASRIARWDGTAWHALGSGLSHLPYAMLWDNASLYPSLYAGGPFVLAGGKGSGFVARWRSAAVWDGGGSDNEGATAANWSGDVAPLADDVAIFDSTSVKEAHLGAGFTDVLRGLVVEESYTGVITQSQSLAISQQLQLHGGTYIVPDFSAFELTVEDQVIHTGGTFQQTRSVNGANVPFLQITGGIFIEKYRGVQVDTSASGANLGSTTVSVQAIDASAGESCPNTDGTTPVYANRCYQITPTTSGPAMVRLWALVTELNGLHLDRLSVYRQTGGLGWTQLLANRSTGSDGGNYRYAEGATTDFGRFLLGAHQTAVTLAGPPTGIVATAIPFTATVSAIGASFPLTYTWSATEQTAVSHVVNGLEDSLPFVWTEPGTKVITVTAETLTETVTATQTMVVNAPVTAVTITGPTEGMMNISYPFTATIAPLNANLPLTVSWQATGQTAVSHTVNSYEDNLSWAWNTPGPKAITVTVENVAGSATTTYEVLILQPVTDVTLTGPTEGLVNSTLSFTATVAPLNATLPLTVSWQVTGQTAVTHILNGYEDTVPFTWSTAGPKEITVTVENVAGSANTTYEVLILQPVTNVALTGPTEGVVNNALPFTATVVPLNATLPLTVSWQATGQTAVTHILNSYEDNLSFTWNAPGSKTMTVTVENRAGMVTTTHEVLLLQPVTGVTLTGPTEGMVNNALPFTATIAPLNATLPLTVTWQATEQTAVSHILNSYEDNLSWVWNTPGSKTMTVTVENSSGMVTTTHEVFIVQPVTGVSLTGPTTGMVSGTLSFTATVAPLNATLPLTVSWQATGQTAVSHLINGYADNLSFTWVTTGTKTITVTAVNATGSATITHTLLITAPIEPPTAYVIYVPFAGKATPALSSLPTAIKPVAKERFFAR